MVGFPIKDDMAIQIRLDPIVKFLLGFNKDIEFFLAESVVAKLPRDADTTPLDKLIPHIRNLCDVVIVLVVNLDPFRAVSEHKIMPNACMFLHDHSVNLKMVSDIFFEKIEETILMTYPDPEIKEATEVFKKTVNDQIEKIDKLIKDMCPK